MDILVNWFVQGFLVVAATAAVLKALPRSRAQARPCCLWAGYLAVLALPLVAHAIDAPPQITAAPSSAMLLGPAIVVPTDWSTSPAIAIGLWLIWSGGYMLRLVRAARAVTRARRHCRACSRTVQARLPHWTQVRSSGRQTRVVVSDDVRTAAVLGVGAPVIALPPTLVDRLSDDDLDRVVIHEWAHVQRRDDVLQIVQQCLHVVVGWHPAVWWLQRQLGLEREI